MPTEQDNLQSIVDFYERAPLLFSLYDKNLRLMNLNQATLKFLKKSSKEEVIGKHVEEIAPGIRETGRLAIYESVLKTGNPVQFRSIVTTPSLGSMHVGVDAFKVAGGVALIAIEVTEWVKEEEARLAELEKKNKELEQFAYVASHDLQEPLETVSSFVGVLHKKYGENLDEKGKKYLGFIIQATHRMKKLVTDVLEYSRIGKKEEMKPVDLNVLVQETIDDMNASIVSSRAKVTFEKLPVLTVCQVEIKELFQNLISNAIKFRKKDEAPLIHIAAEKSPAVSGWKFSVSDNGIGLEEKFYERIFLIFQRLHNRSEYDGTGIGLTLCKKIAEIHGGKIWVTSESGKGSTFYFTLKDFSGQ